MKNFANLPVPGTEPDRSPRAPRRRGLREGEEKTGGEDYRLHASPTVARPSATARMIGISLTMV